MTEELIEFEHLKDHTQTCSLFTNWLNSRNCYRRNSDKYRIHRMLRVNDGVNNPIDEFAKKICNHHIPPSRQRRLDKKRRILTNYDFQNYISSQQLLPTVIKTQRANLGEIILGEYLEKVTDNEIIVKRLRYNSNVEQSMKGDDILLLNRDEPLSKVYVGESKFRTHPSRAVVEELLRDYSKEITRPLSISFTINILDSIHEHDQAILLEDLLDEISKGNVDIINVGMLISNHNTANNIERHLVSKNPNFVAISLGIPDPATFADDCFNTACNYLKEGDYE